MATNNPADDEEKQTLLEPPAPSSSSSMTPVQKAITQGFKSTADLAKHLPTGTVLAFQILGPVFTNQGQCDDANRTMTACLVALCGLACFLLSFTDSFRDAAGHVRYAVATTTGLWVIDGSAPPEPEIAKTYRLKFIDFLHAFMSLLVFAAVALLDKNVESCFYPVMSPDTKQVLTAVPLAAGVIGGGLFVIFPSTRHGIGFPLSSV
ncbi:protein DMP4-like [Typha angustifolia]|uniref:protein DMP4-like n=1 Tax=Typha angustifolia TaxID=59011 RepID=UPI003C2D93F3